MVAVVVAVAFRGAVVFVVVGAVGGGGGVWLKE